MTSPTYSGYCSRTLRAEVQPKRLAHVEKAAMSQPLQKQPSLPVRRAFVVQFRAEAELEQGCFRGRVEHVLSGQVTKFSSVEELLAFFAHVLSQERQPRGP